MEKEFTIIEKSNLTTAHPPVSEEEAKKVTELIEKLEEDQNE